MYYGLYTYDQQNKSNGESKSTEEVRQADTGDATPPPYVKPDAGDLFWEDEQEVPNEECWA